MNHFTHRAQTHRRSFWGRMQEQQSFRDALAEVLSEDGRDAPPLVTLIHGDGGAGKTALSERLCALAMNEQPFEGELQCLWIDWAEERKRQVALQVGRLFIEPEAVYDAIYRVVARAGWENYFDEYQAVMIRRIQAEQRVGQLLEEFFDDQLAPLRTLNALTAARLLRMPRPDNGVAGEMWLRAAADAGMTVTMSQAVYMHDNARQFLSARMSRESFQSFANSQGALSRALAKGLRSLAESKRLLVIFDDYEVIDVVDAPFIREVIHNSGPRVLWILSGRNDLAHTRPFGFEDFIGYEDEFHQRLLTFVLPPLEPEDVRIFFDETPSAQPISEIEANTIQRATHGAPLAIKTAVEMSKRGSHIDAIIGNEPIVPAAEIIEQMTRSYLRHTVNCKPDRTALFALALADGDREILAAMLRSQTEAFGLTAELQRLHRLYVSVNLTEARLHDAPMAFMRAYLLLPNQRRDESIRELRQTAIQVMRSGLRQSERELLPTLQQRCQDRTWQETWRNIIGHAFSLDESSGWQHLIPRFVEGLAYNRRFGEALLADVEAVATLLSERGRTRLEILRRGFAEDAAPADRNEMLSALDGMKAWLQEEGGSSEDGNERLAILNWQRAVSLMAINQQREALQVLLSAAEKVPARAVVLREEISAAIDRLSRQLLWPEGDQARNAPLPDIVRLLSKATMLSAQNARFQYKLGVAYKRMGREEDAIRAHQQSISIDNRFALPFIDIGNIYASKDDALDVAVQMYQEAIDRLDPNRQQGLLARVYFYQGSVYAGLGRYRDAIESYNEAIRLNPNFAAPHRSLGDIAAMRGQYDRAIEFYYRALAINPQNAEAHQGLGDVFTNLGRYDEALVQYVRSGQLKRRAAPFVGQGNIYRLQRRYERAIDLYRQALGIESDHAMAYAFIAACYRLLHRKSDYDYWVEQARRRMGKEDVYNRARFAAISGEDDKAIDLLSEAIKLNPLYRDMARRSPDFEFIRRKFRFRRLVGG